MDKSQESFKNIADIRRKIKEEIKESDKKQLIFRGESRCKDYCDNCRNKYDNELNCEACSKKLDRKISSTLYRQQEDIIEESKLYKKQKEIMKDSDKEDILKSLNISVNIPVIQEEIIDKARKHFPAKTSNIEILTEIQHYGGKTNLIDFSYNFLVALFFACDGNIAKDGRLILLRKNRLKSAENIIKNNQNEDLILESKSKDNRPIFQSSIFAYMQKGYIESEDKRIKIIKIPKEAKKEILEELRYCYNITTDTIYNDLQGFIGNDKTYFYIGLCHQEANNHQEAEESFSQAIELDANDLKAYNGRGNARINLEKQATSENEKKQYLEEAIKDFEKAIELDPDYAKAYSGRGNARINLEKQATSEDEKKKYLKEACDDFDTAIKLDPKDAWAYYNRGNARRSLEKYDEAIEDYDEALKLNPKLTEAFYNKGIALVDKNTKKFRRTSNR